MTKFMIEYNPYIQKIIFKKNERVLNNNSNIGSRSKNRLQELLGNQIENWKGLFEEIERECDDDEIDLRFKGRRIDFEDLQEALKEYEGDAVFKLSCEEMKNDADLIKELDKIFDEIKKKIVLNFRRKIKMEKISLKYIKM